MCCSKAQCKNGKAFLFQSKSDFTRAVTLTLERPNLQVGRPALLAGTGRTRNACYEPSAGLQGGGGVGYNVLVFGWPLVQLSS